MKAGGVIRRGKGGENEADRRDFEDFDKFFCFLGEFMKKITKNLINLHSNSLF